MSQEEVDEVKLATKEAYYKLRLLDAHQALRILVNQKSTRIVESRIAKIKPRVFETPSKPRRIYTEDTGDHARLLRLGERVTFNNPDFEWDKDSDDIKVDDEDGETDTEDLLDLSVNSGVNSSSEGRSSILHIPSYPNLGSD